MRRQDRIKVNRVRKLLLLMENITQYYNHGITFVIKQREQSKAPTMVKNSICLRVNVNKYACPFPRKKYGYENVECGFSNIKRMVISEKKFDKDKNNNVVENKKWMAENTIKDALVKMRSFGLFMRGEVLNKRAKSVNKKEETRNRTEMLKLNEKEVAHVIRKSSLTKVYETITSFITTLLKETKKSDIPTKTSNIRRRSSYYNSLSEGSLTEEEIY